MHALVTADTVGGVWTYARELVTGLVRRGVRVTLVSFGEIPTVEQTDWMQGLPGLDYRPTAFRLEWMQDAEADIQASSEYLRSIVSEVRPDVLHLNQYCYGALPTDIPKIVVAHSDVVSWWVAVHGVEPKDSSWMNWYRTVVAEGLAGASVVVAPSAWMLQQTQRHYGQFPQSKVIYNGRNPGLFNPYTSKEDLVVSVGRLWDAGKQVRLLLAHDHRIPVAIIGSQEHPEKRMEEMARSGSSSCRPARSNVNFHGAQPHPRLAQTLSRASIYAATSCYEPFGLAPLEAALSNCALIANDIPPFREIWGETARYFDTNDAHGLAQAVETLASNPELRREYASRALGRARQRYTAEQMVESYVGLYSEMVSCSPRSAEPIQAGVALR
jgi:glycosyltransferase involved in cell wall biosynthesis